MNKPPFTERWLALTAAARRLPLPPPPLTLDVERILAARRAPRRLRIGWFPPGLAAAAVLAFGLSWQAGLDPRPALSDARMFLADLPAQVPHAPAFPPPLTVPSPTVLTALLPAPTTWLPTFSETSP